MLDVSINRHLGELNLSAHFTMGQEIFALVGPSGAGKSATLNIIAGFLRPDSGRLRLRDQILFDAESGVNLRPEKRGLGYVLQEPFLFPHYTVRGNLEYGLKARGSGEIAFDEVVSVLELEPLLQRKPTRLSGGEKQRVAIGRALLSSPALLLMDEPVSSLDQETRWRILRFIKTCHQRFALPILYVTHSLEEVEYLSDSMAVLEKGTVVAAGSREKLMRSGQLLRTSQGKQFTNLLRARVERSDESAEITSVNVGGKSFSIPVGAFRQGEELLLGIKPNQIVVSKEHPANMSARNIYCGKVRAVLKGDNTVMVLLDSGFDLYVEVVQDTIRDLNIDIGDELHYMFKARAVIVHRLGE